MSSKLGLEFIKNSKGFGGQASKSSVTNMRNENLFLNLVSTTKENKQNIASPHNPIKLPQKEKFIPQKLNNETTINNSQNNNKDINNAEGNLVRVEESSSLEDMGPEKNETGQLGKLQLKKMVGQQFQQIEAKFIVSSIPEEAELKKLSKWDPEEEFNSGHESIMQISNEFITAIKDERPEEEKDEIEVINAYSIITPIMLNDNKAQHWDGSLDGGVLVPEQGQNNFGLKEKEINIDPFEVDNSFEEEALLALLSNKNLKPEPQILPQKIDTIITDSRNEFIHPTVLENGAGETKPINYNKEILLKEVEIIKPVSYPGINTIFTGSTQAGREIPGSMRRDQKENTSEMIIDDLITSDDLMEEMEINLNLENNNSNPRSKFKSEIINLGGSIETNKDGKLIISFKENLVPKTGNIHRSDQISLSLKEAVNTGKSNVIINMYPKALGTIDINIEFNQVGGKQVVESIKITADRRDTLDIIQKSQAELRKNLTEITELSKDASLEFNLKHNDSNGNKGNYFQNSEERENWMNKFEHQLHESAELTSSTNYNDNRNYITEDSVNILA